jgi:ATP/maltotriose-dependent transcriptional regulator MalT
VLAEELPRIRKDAADKGDLYSLTTLAVFPEAMDRLRDGHPEGALAVIAEGLAQWPQDGMTFQKIQSIMAQGWIYMYMGEPLEALRAVAGRWKELKRTHVFASEMHRLAFLDLRCRASLAVAARSPNPGMLAAAERDLRRLHRESLPIAHALADSAQGSLHCIRGSINSALDLFQRAHDAFREMDLKLFATATRRASGLLIGGDQGRTIVREADDWFERQRFANGAAMADACVPLPQPK